MQRKLSILLLAAWCVPLVGLVSSSQAQETPEPEEDVIISLDVEVVNILATVRDKQGHLVTNLGKDDFIIEEEGKPQTIKYFSRQTDLPLTLGLLVDTSVSQQRLLGEERRASAQFFSQVLRHEKDLVFLISFDIDVELLQDLTASQALLSRALDSLEIQGSPGGIHPGPVPTSGRQPGTLLHDAVFLASDEMLRGQVGRKALVLISDGVDYGSRTKEEDAIEAAHRSDVVAYSVLFLDRGFYNRAGVFGGGGGASTLKKLARETGGTMFEVRKKRPLKEIFDQIQDELRSQYSLGYTSNFDPSQEGFRKINLRTKDKSLNVQTRSGYYPKASRN